MAKECNAPPGDDAHSSTAGEVGDALERPPAPATGPATLKFVMQNLQAACERVRSRDAGDVVQADPPDPQTAPAPAPSPATSASAELTAALAASTTSVGATELVPTDIWWAQRWIEKATPGQVAAMRALLL